MLGPQAVILDRHITYLYHSFFYIYNTSHIRQQVRPSFSMSLEKYSFNSNFGVRNRRVVAY